jgi:hypothetical protein
MTSGVGPPRRPFTSSDGFDDPAHVHRLAEMCSALRRTMLRRGVPPDIIQTAITELNHRIRGWIQDNSAHHSTGSWTSITNPPDALVSELTEVCRRLSRPAPSTTNQATPGSGNVRTTVNEVVDHVGRHATPRAASEKQMSRLPPGIYLMSLAKCTWTYLRLPSFLKSVRMTARHLEDALALLPTDRPASFDQLHSVVLGARRQMKIPDDSMLLDTSLVAVHPANTHSLVVLLIDTLAFLSVQLSGDPSNPASADACLFAVREIQERFHRFGGISWSENSTSHGIDFMRSPPRKVLREATRDPTAFLESLLRLPKESLLAEGRSGESFVDWFQGRFHPMPWSDLQLARILWDELLQNQPASPASELALLEHTLLALETEQRQKSRRERETSILRDSEVGYLELGGTAENELARAFAAQAISRGSSNERPPPLCSLLGDLRLAATTDQWLKHWTDYMAQRKLPLEPTITQGARPSAESAHADLVKDLLRLAYKSSSSESGDTQPISSAK